MIDSTGELLAVGLFARHLRRGSCWATRWPSRWPASRCCLPCWAIVWPFRPHLLHEPGAALLRRDAERDPGGGAAVHLHGLGAGTLGHRREPARHHGPALRALRGGLGFSVVIVGAILAASTGVVGATVVTMSLISLPTMLRAGYDPRLACGTICAAATLAQIIPPSTVLIFVADMLQGANQLAQLETGNFAPRPVSVGDLFAGALLPGLLLVRLYPAAGSPGWPGGTRSGLPAVPMTAAERRTCAVRSDRLVCPAPPHRGRAGLDPGRHRHRHRIGLDRCRGRPPLRRPARPARASASCARPCCAPPPPAR